MITVRDADRSDRDVLRDWRNDPDTRSASLTEDPVSAADHASWFERALADPDRILLIGEIGDGSPTGDARVGMVRFDRADDHAEVSINLSPRFRGLGLGRELLRTAIDSYLASGGAPVITATIRVGNRASLRLFEGAGFSRVLSDGETERYELHSAPMRSGE